MKKTLVLHIEDNAVNRDATGIMLERLGYSVVTAVNGIEGIEVAKSQHPDVILMDIRMPIMDGLEATKRLKDDPVTSNIPIIALTAHSVEPGNRHNCMEAGCIEYLLKPVDSKVLVGIINKHVH